MHDDTTSLPRPPSGDPDRPPTVEAEKLRTLGLAVLETEAEALLALRARIGDEFVAACQHMLGCRGRIIVVGMGKSGHISGKIAATLASTGTPAFFVHPGEASHGDLGMITPQDVVLALSNSGETDEILTILPIIKRLGVPMIALTGNPASTLGRQATVCLDVSVAREACPLGLAPTASTTAALAMGDALAIALLEARGFGSDDFARSHPAGRLGRRLLLLVDDLLHTGSDLPVVTEEALVAEALLEMTAKRLGMTAVVDASGALTGIFTDGDLRRGLDRDIDVHTAQVVEAMTRDCKTVAPGTLAAEALHLMQTHKINALLVVDAARKPVGALNIHDLLRSGVL
ncbi:MAG: D-arabinose 5-phosphate isomerase [Gammaproteobacteria bacterium]|nr:MAG: D-arabinose 5-phosphate isomerase [Gammaproteobacteria bacterium]